MSSGAGGITEYDDEDISFGSDEGKDPEAAADADEAGEPQDDSEDFFSDDEELEDVKLDGEAGSGSDSEAEFGSQGSAGDYGDEYGDEVQEEEEAQVNKKKKVKGDGDGFASYEDFAQLLDEDAEKQVDNKEKQFLKKRTYNNFEAA